MDRPLKTDRVTEHKKDDCALVRASAEAALLCPRCWTAQRAERAFCWHCGTEFIPVGSHASLSSEAADKRR